MLVVVGVWTFLRALFFGSAAIALENLALRHQLLVLHRSVRRPRLARSSSRLASGPRRSMRTAKMASQPRTAASLGGAYALSGRPDEAVSLLERAIVHAESIGFMYGHSLVVATLAEAHLRASQLDEANGAVRQALELARQHRQRGWEARKLKLCGEIAAHPDCPDGATADTHYSAALTLGSEPGCVRSSPSATWVSASSTGASASASGHRSTSRRQRRCTARWTWTSG